MEEPEIHIVKWKKPIRKFYILCDSNSMTFWEHPSSGDSKKITGCQSLRRRDDWVEHRGFFWKRWEYQTTWPASWEICMQVRTGHGPTDWFQIGKGVCQGCILSPGLFNLHEEYIMWNVSLHASQAGIKIAGRNTNNLRYADDTTLMTEGKEELKHLLMKVREESEKALKTQLSKKWRSWHLVLSRHGKWMGENWKQWQT